MNAILNFLRDEQKMRTLLFWYWVISPLVFFFYIFSVSAGTATDYREILEDPTVALSFLTSCMSIIMGFLLRASGRENENTERIFCLYAFAQQLLVGNPFGFLFSFLLARALWDAPREKFAPSNIRWLIIAGMVLIGFLTLLTVVARINQLF